MDDQTPAGDVAVADADEQRSYTQKEVDALGAKGQAFKNPDGTYSYPVANVADLKNAIRDVGRGNANHDSIRKYIIGRAKALGQSGLIPDNWGADGSLGASRAQPTPEDHTVAAGLKNAKTAVAAVKADQLTDPDNDTDPDDKAVMAALNAAEAALDDAIVAQSKDGHDDSEQNSLADAHFEQRRALATSLKGSREVREFTVDGMECRQLDDGTMRMSGYASLTEEPYQIGSTDRGFEETIARGAFKRTLGEGPDTVLLINHDGIPLAGTRNGSLALAEDARGLHWTADLDPADPDSQMLARKVDSGLMNQCSFAFVATGEKWSDDMRQRRITSVSIHRGDVSVVTHGANENTNVGLREMVAAVEQRASKTLSASSRTEIEAARDRLTDLLNGADAKSDPDEAPDDDAGAEIKAAAEKVLTGRKLDDYAFERRRQQMELLKRKVAA